MIYLDEKKNEKQKNITKTKWIKSDNVYMLNGICETRSEKYPACANIIYTPDKELGEGRFLFRVYGETVKFIKENKAHKLNYFLDKVNLTMCKEIGLSEDDDFVYDEIRTYIDNELSLLFGIYNCDKLILGYNSKNLKLTFYFESEDMKIGYDDYRIIFYIDNLKLNIHTRNIFTNY